MTQKEIKEYIIDMDLQNDVLLFENPSYNTAFMGLSDDNRAIYNFDLMVEFLLNDNKYDDFTVYDAIEFIEYNTIRSLPYYGDNAPIILYPIKL